MSLCLFYTHATSLCSLSDSDCPAFPVSPTFPLLSPALSNPLALWCD